MTQASQAELLPGTSDLVASRTPIRGPNHGYGSAQRINEISPAVLMVGESSFYRALQHLILDGYVKREWGISENDCRTRFYTLTAADRKLVTQRGTSHV